MITLLRRQRDQPVEQMDTLFHIALHNVLHKPFLICRKIILNLDLDLWLDEVDVFEEALIG